MMTEGDVAMTNGKNVNRLEPPDLHHDYSFKEPGKLIIQLLYLAVMFVPLFICGFLEQFITKPKLVYGKVVMITGTARGLGRGFAEKFAELGCKVACVDVDEEQNRETVAAINEKYPGSAKAYQCNVALSQEIGHLKRAIKEDLGDVNIIIHNAAIVATNRITDFEDIYVRGMIAVNLTSHFLIYREFLPHMIERNEGHIVAIGSVGSFYSVPGLSMYCATKHGVAGLMESIHYELNERANNEVKVSIVCPQVINTSATYKKTFKSRSPKLTIQETVNVAVHGILRNRRIITVPSFFYMSLHMMKLFPDRVNNLIRRIFYMDVSVLPMDMQKNMPFYKTIEEISQIN